MKKLRVVGSMTALLAGVARAGDATNLPGKETTPEALKDDQRKQFVVVHQELQKKVEPLVKEAPSGGKPEEIHNALVEVVAAVNAGVSAATAREAFRLADASLPEACGETCSPPGSAGR